MTMASVSEFLAAAKDEVLGASMSPLGRLGHLKTLLMLSHF